MKLNILWKEKRQPEKETSQYQMCHVFEHCSLGLSCGDHIMQTKSHDDGKFWQWFCLHLITLRYHGNGGPLISRKFFSSR